VEPRQLRFWGEADGALAFGPAVRPEVSDGKPLHSGDALLVLLPDRFASHDVTCRVDGLGATGEAIGSGSGVAHVEAAREVECRAVLVAVTPEARAADAGARLSCTGCLDGKGVCKPGTDDRFCGAGGGACAQCEHAERCMAGVCVG
jgi:hypothetical protein